MTYKSQTQNPGDLHSGDARVEVDQCYRLRFVADAFDPQSTVLADVMPQTTSPNRVLVCIDQGVLASHPDLPERIDRYFHGYPAHFDRRGECIIVPGGEQAKNDPAHAQQVLHAIHEQGICRHSFVLAIGGGAVLDTIGYAAAIAHRGVRLIRIPTTTLAQADAGIGVKNGINAFGKKNFLGTFAVPWAVINDASFLNTLSLRDWRCGFAEAIKVALVKDAAFFEHIERAATQLHSHDIAAAQPIIQQSAELHLRHIVDGGDPYELTEARPLDFGHWAAHKLEQMTNWQLRHGEAVAIGLAIDVTYASLCGMLANDTALRITDCLHALGFDLFDDALHEHETLLRGLEEFREHLGGTLTVQMLTDIGIGVDVHEIDTTTMIAAIEHVRSRSAVSR
jgi:3-dehydroquinate synthase